MAAAHVESRPDRGDKTQYIGDFIMMSNYGTNDFPVSGMDIARRQL